MEVYRDLASLRAGLAAARAGGRDVALVPTMGALHAGHVALVEAARRPGTIVVASIFVNPTQFGAGEDLSRYPRKELSDIAMLTDAGCDMLWLPPVEAMYPSGFATSVSVAGVSEGWDGASRPGHFDGVATVVAKLFNQVRPTRAYFGEKDFQQLAVIRRMVADLDFEIEVTGVPTQREDDGLALSSRNVYLLPEERQKATALPRALGVAARAVLGGGDPARAVADAIATLTTAGFAVDYVALVDAETLESDPAPGRRRQLLAAARLGNTRLIDNLAVDPA